jgi:hypothetical protein
MKDLQLKKWILDECGFCYKTRSFMSKETGEPEYIYLGDFL